MQKTTLKLKKLHLEAKTPIYATEGSAGCDFYSVEETIILPGETKKIRTGIALEIPAGYFMKLEGRSGFSSKGLIKTGGVIDSDYRGEIHIVLYNSTPVQFTIGKGDRIAQGILMSINQTSFEEVNELSETKRGGGGFQSTGLK
ncbi:MAG TPA: dUTP diphosphatase [Candidatus Nanoarchaeia archaeon]|nr:dUTP diphosphatase [Candidatus Nanoarchaeia archaeon]